MRLAKFSILSLLVVLFAASCDSQKGSTIEGTVSDAGGMTIYLDQTEPDNTKVSLLNTKADENGNFTFQMAESLKPGVYSLRAGTRAADVILNGNESNVNITGTMDDFAQLQYQAKGAPLTEEFLDIISKFVGKSMTTEELIEKTKGDLNPLIGYVVATKMFRMNPQFMEVHEAVASKLKDQYPDIRLTEQFEKQLSSVKVAYARQMANEKIKVGEPAPDIELPGPDGKMHRLSDLKGKIVLLDFWASWCGPCRKANPKVVDVYQRYNDKGFDVFSVSLDGLDSRTKQRYNSEEQVQMQMDRSKERWIAAIEKDNLMWDNHVSDLQKWESAPAADYGVRSIPKTFLIDREGNIAVINPRFNLEDEVKKLL